MTHVQHWLFLHGYESSPQSRKAMLLRDYVADQPSLKLHIPTLSRHPREAMATIESLLSTLSGPVGLIGSSMGGYYAALLAERLGMPAVLINPVVHAHALFVRKIGEAQGADATLTSILDYLRENPLLPVSNPEQFLVLLQTADETLDYREAHAWYADCSMLTLRGGDHGFQGFETVLPLIAAFLGKRWSATAD